MTLAMPAPLVARAPDDGETTLPLFVDDKTLRRLINPRIGEDRFRALLRAAELRDFPRFRALWGGRYWPAVKAWLDADNGVANNAVAAATVQAGVEDGPEEFGASAQPEAGLQARAPSPALLDRAPGRARPDGLSRPLHRAAARR
jgi:hypothetical protein